MNFCIFYNIPLNWVSTLIRTFLTNQHERGERQTRCVRQRLNTVSTNYSMWLEMTTRLESKSCDPHQTVLINFSITGYIASAVSVSVKLFLFTFRRGKNFNIEIQRLMIDGLDALCPGCSSVLILTRGPLLCRDFIQTVKLGKCIYFFPLCAQLAFL